MDTNNTSKMSWLKLDDNWNFKYRIANTKKRYGTVCIPTGCGKSGVAIEDIMWRIKKVFDGECENLYINVSTPILKLTQQFVNDLFEVMHLYKVDTSNIKFFINSSDVGGNYNSSELDMNTNFFKDLEERKSKVNIIASCHKSLWRVENLLKGGSYKENFINYFDEAHLLPLNTRKSDEEGNIVDANERINLDNFCKNSFAVYALTATSDPTVTKTLNSYEHIPCKPNMPFMYHILPRVAIQNGDILPPLVKYLKRPEEDSVSIEDLKWIMNDAKESNPLIPHKILVTCNNDRALLKKLYTDVINLGYKAYGICSSDEVSDTYKEFYHPNIQEFSKQIEQEENDCFVFHVKMLTQGIDIKGLTDCVIFSRDHGKQEKYRMIIQTIGRVLRCLQGERGKSFVGSKELKYKDSPRKKPYGGVYFISSGNTDMDIQSIESATRGIIERYYGLDCLDFSRASIHEGSSDNIDPGVDVKSKGHSDLVEDIEIKELLLSLKCSLVNRYKSALPYIKGLGVYKDIKRECDNGLNALPGEYNSVEWLMDTQVTELLYDKIPSLFEGIGGFNIDFWKKVIG